MFLSRHLFFFAEVNQKNRNLPRHLPSAEVCLRRLLLDTAIQKTFNVSRSNTLKEPLEQSFTRKVPIVLTFHPFHYKVRDIITRNFGILKNDVETLSMFTDNSLISFRRNKSINHCLIHSALKQNSSLPAGTFSCGRARCKTCVFFSKTTAIFESKSKFTIRRNFTCASSNFVYCISCCKCHKLYIGKTGRYLSDRFAEHLPSVRNNDVDKSVTRHFNSTNHSISDMKVFAISSIFVGNNSRKRQERRLVFNLGTTHPFGLNQHFSIIQPVISFC